ncbi:MAG: glycine cleavage system aminomethyltransferase GcvT [Stellaceae bacterium]
MTDDSLARTPLYELHESLGAKLVPFAGYAMPLQYPAGIVAEHLHTRSKASLFDVSHMAQVLLSGADVAAALERLVPGDIAQLRDGRQRYTLFTNDEGGIGDDLMVAKDGAALRLVVNAARKSWDIEHLRRHMGGQTLEPLADRALLALQGPAAANVLSALAPGIDALAFMALRHVELAGARCIVSRSGYTGEDGFEISVAAADAVALARRLLEAPEVMPAGLGARDTLRLEAGLCLYGADIDETTSVVEADLSWTIAPRRRSEGGFPGSAAIAQQLKDGAPRRRVGLKLEGRQIARAGSTIVDASGAAIGHVTSGSFGPSVGGAIAMGYVASAEAEEGRALGVTVRGASRLARIVKLPFISHRYRQTQTPGRS